MPTTSSAVSVGTTAVKVFDSQNNHALVYLQDGDYEGQSVVYVGGSDVTVQTGIKLSKINVTVFSTYDNDDLFAVSDTSTGEVRVIGIT